MKNFMINLIQHPVSLIVVSIVGVAIGERTFFEIQRKKAEAWVKKHEGPAEVHYHGLTLNADCEIKKSEQDEELRIMYLSLHSPSFLVE